MCYCKKIEPFEMCCKPVIDAQNASTAEILMRSRYSAFATQNGDYIIQTQSKHLTTTTAKALALELQLQRFISLKVIESSEFEVYFQVKFIEDSVLYTLYLLK